MNEQEQREYDRMKDAHDELVDLLAVAPAPPGSISLDWRVSMADYTQWFDAVQAALARARGTES